MVKFTQLLAVASAALGANAAYSNSSAPVITGIDVISANTGSNKFHNKRSPAFLEVSFQATATGECWFTAPEQFTGFPDLPFEWEYGTVKPGEFQSNNFSIEFTKAPRLARRASGNVKLSIATEFDASFVSSVSGPSTSNFEFVTSSGSIKSSAQFVDYPTNEIAIDSDLSGQTIEFSLNVPAALIKSAFTISASKQPGYAFSPEFSNLYYVTESSAFGEGAADLVSSAEYSDASTADKISVTYSGSLPSNAIAIRLTFRGTVQEARQFYTSITSVSFATISQTITAYTYSKGYSGPILAPTIVSTGAIVPSASTGSLISSTSTGSTASGSTASGSVTGSTSATTTTEHSLSTTVITTCPTCEHKATTVAVSTATVTENGVVTEYTTYCPISTISPVPTVTEGSTVAPSVVITEVESGVFTVYTTYCPYTAATSTATVSATTTTEHPLSTTVITTCPTCEEKATTVAYSTATVTENGKVTEYTTYCPISTASPVVTVSEGTTVAPSVVISEVESGVFTIYTTVCPYTAPSTTSAATPATPATPATASTSTVYVTAGAETTTAASGASAVSTSAGSAAPAVTTVTVGAKITVTSSGASASPAAPSSGASASPAAPSSGAAVTTVATASGASASPVAPSTGAQSSSVTISSYEGAAAAIKGGLTAVVLGFAAFLI